MVKQAQKTETDKQQLIRDTIGIHFGEPDANPRADLNKEANQVTSDEVKAAKDEANTAVAAVGAANAVVSAGNAAATGGESLISPASVTGTLNSASNKALNTGVQSQNSQHPAPPPAPAQGSNCNTQNACN